MQMYEHREGKKSVWLPAFPFHHLPNRKGLAHRMCLITPGLDRQKVLEDCTRRKHKEPWVHLFFSGK